MDGAAVVSAVREDRATELDRLGSEKSLVAVTDARLDQATVFGAAAAAEARAHDTFTAWADDEPVAPAREAFRTVAATEADHYERVAALVDDPPTDPAPDPLHDHLRGVDATVERVGAGLIGRPLVASRSLLQVVNFCVNEAARDAADLFRELRADSDATVETGADLLDTVCTDTADYERASAAAADTIAVAYEAYAARLDALGIDPKPVC